jgi:hypothetical protein
MTNPTARAISSVAVSAGCCGVAFAEPTYSVLAIAGMIAGIYTIWSKA